MMLRILKEVNPGGGRRVVVAAVGCDDPLAGLTPIPVVWSEFRPLRGAFIEPP